MQELTYIGLGYIGGGIGVGLALIGAGLGIGKIGVACLEAEARQPEVAGDLRANMIIAAALIEGLAFFALVISLLAILNISAPKTVAAPAAPAPVTQQISK